MICVAEGPCVYDAHPDVFCKGRNVKTARHSFSLPARVSCLRVTLIPGDSLITCRWGAPPFSVSFGERVGARPHAAGLGRSKERGAPLFRVLCERVGSEDASGTRSRPSTSTASPVGYRPGGFQQTMASHPPSALASKSGVPPSGNCAIDHDLPQILVKPPGDPNSPQLFHSIPEIKFQIMSCLPP